MEKQQGSGRQGRSHLASTTPGNRWEEAGDRGMTVFTGKHSVVHGGHSPSTARWPAIHAGPSATHRGTHCLQQVGLKPFCWGKGESHFHTVFISSNRHNKLRQTLQLKQHGFIILQFQGSETPPRAHQDKKVCTGCIPFWRFLGRICFLAHLGYWQILLPCGCRTEFSIALLTVS